ncbi:hypothetical protein MSAN_01316200 [Mycena sanguinolenta]|uniref:F-box domain-containing protein n=1 Tax=Mycena sanguinolenta TaxID=230812 RepID=A0A8H6YA45_9AGAR|nr:hypothetical protein MSAN_01316200 [Mycena sanguinolenta]
MYATSTTFYHFLRVNKPFRRLALSKQLWVSLIRDLSSRYFIPHLEHIGGCTTAQLIAKVKCLVRGPETWSQKSSVPPTPSFSKKLPPAKDARILPGGRYFAVRLDSGALQCRDVLTGQTVWTHGFRCDYPWWEMQMLEDGHTAFFVFFEYFGITMVSELSLVQVNFKTGHSEELFSIELDRNSGQYYHPTVSGDFLAIALFKEMQSMIIAVNWRQRTYVVFDTSEASRISAKDHMAFVPGHIILATASSEPPHDHIVVVYALRSIASHWRPVEEFRSTNLPPREIRIRPGDVEPVLTQTLEHNGRVFRRPRSRGIRRIMMLHANPIRHGAYKLMLYASGPSRFPTGSSRPNPVDATVLFTYALNIAATDGSLFWAKISAFPAMPEYIYSSLSYAGYTVVTTLYSGPLKVVDPRLLPAPSHRLLKWVRTRPAMREVMVVSKQPADGSLSSTGVLLVARRDGIEVSCWI